MTGLPLLRSDLVSPSFSPQQLYQGSWPHQVRATMDLNQRLTEWQSGLCDCCDDINTCCSGFWCCPCAACSFSKQMGHANCLPICDVCTPAITACCGLPCCVAPALLATRVEFRSRYGIRGSLFKDILVSCFCEWCAWCQMRREYKYQQEKPNMVYMQHPTLAAPVVDPPMPVRPVGYTVASY